MILIGVVAFRWPISPSRLLPAAPATTWQKFTPLFPEAARPVYGRRRRPDCVRIRVILGGRGRCSRATLHSSTCFPTCSPSAPFISNAGLVPSVNGGLGFAVILGVLMWRLTQDQWLTRRKLSLLEMAAGGRRRSRARRCHRVDSGHAAATDSRGGHDFGVESPGRRHASFRGVDLARGPPAVCAFPGLRTTDRSIFPAFVPSPAVARRFSAIISFVIVGALILTGNNQQHLHRRKFSGAIVTTDYGRLLCLKLFLFLVILGIAASEFATGSCCLSVRAAELRIKANACKALPLACAPPAKVFGHDRVLPRRCHRGGCEPPLEQPRRQIRRRLPLPDKAARLFSCALDF